MKKGNALPFFSPYLGFFSPAHLGAPRRSRSSSASRRHQRSPPPPFSTWAPRGPTCQRPSPPFFFPSVPISLSLTLTGRHGHEGIHGFASPSYKGVPGPSLGFLLAFPFLPCAAASPERFPKPSSFSCAPWPPRVQAHRRPSSRRRWLSSSCPRTSTRRPGSIQMPSRARGLHP